MTRKIILTLPLAFLLYLLFEDPRTSFADRRLNVVHIRQMPELPRGCEVTSLAMLLQNEGVNVSKMTLAKNIKKVPFTSNGYHGHPNDGFVGNMYTFSKSGLGVYHKPIFNLAQTYLSDNVVDLTGSPISQVYKMIDSGQPVWVITNSLYTKLSPSYFRTWKTTKGKIQITYKEHSVLVTGYNSKSVYINDPLGKKNRVISRANFEKSWVQMGSQAISAVPKPNWSKTWQSGQTGSLVVLKPINLWQRTDSGLLRKQILRPGDRLAVYGYTPEYGGQYQVGDNAYVTKIDGYIKYTTPSKAFLASVQ